MKLANISVFGSALFVFSVLWVAEEFGQIRVHASLEFDGISVGRASCTSGDQYQINCGESCIVVDVKTATFDMGDIEATYIIGGGTLTVQDLVCIPVNGAVCNAEDNVIVNGGEGSLFDDWEAKCSGTYRPANPIVTVTDLREGVKDGRRYRYWVAVNCIVTRSLDDKSCGAKYKPKSNSGGC